MAATTPSAWKIRWIADGATLCAVLDEWNHPPVVGVDTEFVRERTFWPRLALVQLSIPGEIMLVDPLQPGVPEALAPLLTDPLVLKVMHSASEDLQAFKTGCDVLPSPLFDTQVAAALAGLGTGLGYQKLVEIVTGTLLSKGETRSDWLQRPLNDKQLEYAGDDVRHLHALHHELATRLDGLGRADWLREDCARAVAAAATGESDPWPHLAMRSAQTLDPDGQARLRRLLVWRDEQARHCDRPRSWIVDNELVVSLARRVPADKASFSRMLDAQPRSPRQLRDALWDVVNAPLSEAERRIPLANAQDNAQRERIKRMQGTVASVARQRELPDGVLASRRQLELLLSTGDWDAALGGWRRKLLEPELAGEVANGD
jgi:ribonuclease D